MILIIFLHTDVSSVCPVHLFFSFSFFFENLSGTPKPAKKLRKQVPQFQGPALQIFEQNLQWPVWSCHDTTKPISRRVTLASSPTSRLNLKINDEARGPSPSYACDAYGGPH